MKISNDAKIKIGETAKKLKINFDEFDWVNAKECTAKLSFYKKIEEEAREKLKSL